MWHNLSQASWAFQIQHYWKKRSKRVYIGIRKKWSFNHFIISAVFVVKALSLLGPKVTPSFQALSVSFLSLSSTTYLSHWQIYLFIVGKKMIIRHHFTHRDNQILINVYVLLLFIYIWITFMSIPDHLSTISSSISQNSSYSDMMELWFHR